MMYSSSWRCTGILIISGWFYSRVGSTIGSGELSSLIQNRIDEEQGRQDDCQYRFMLVTLEFFVPIHTHRASDFIAPQPSNY
ncbi:hypothetical protein DFH11DRAFT_1622379, partial [Phellopilus nigrolimitatus]